MILTLTDGTQLNAGVISTGAGDPCLRILVYIALGMGAVSIAGLIGVVAYLFSKRKSLAPEL